ncbi:MAG: MBL fold metallo-hydrolase [Chloroflexi bacterium]|nr:MBL fold metallo-hydrolase [Chloroflexota bacterium]
MTSQQVPDGAALPPPHIEEVGPGIFAYLQPDGSWCLNNAAFLTDGRGVVVIDALATERRTRDLRAAIARTTDKPVSTLINTHHHLDHTLGNAIFGPEVTIVAHDLCREEIVAAGDGVLAGAQRLFPAVDFGEVGVVPPMLTFEESATLYAGDLAVELEYVGPAHTTNDVVAWIPERRLLITGDVIFNQGTPFAAAGSIAGWLQTLEDLREIGAETLIPGHGPVCGPEVIDEVAAYLRFVQEVARRGFEAGATPLELARDTDLGRFAHLLDSERLVGNLHRAYSELRGEALGAAIDFARMAEDMVAFNGGPVRCLA